MSNLLSNSHQPRIVTNVALVLSDISRMNSNMTVQTEVPLQNIRPVLDLGPLIEEAQIRIKKIDCMWFVVFTLL